MESARANKAPVSTLAFDIDYFKSINDRFGHGAGDAMLQLFATVVRKTMRADDVIGRLGGEEFIAILPGSLTDATAAAERVRSAFAAAGVTRDEGDVTATVSIGVACGSPSVPIESLIARADAALYRAKMNGRDRVETEAFVTSEEHRGAPGKAAQSPSPQAGESRAGGMLRRFAPGAEAKASSVATSSA
jgi:diguanylate cyclase (GGDEF)-like protein